MGKTIGYNLFTTRDAQYHSTLKHPVASAYGFKSALEFEPIVTDCINTFVRRMDEDMVQSKEKKRCDLGAWMQYCKLPMCRGCFDFGLTWQMHSTLLLS